MSNQRYNVLFICTRNSARSIMAEGLLNTMGGDRFKAYSAGSHPTGALNPFALRTLELMHIATAGFRSKSWDEFSVPGAPEMDFVFTVCDRAAGEECPVWPGQPMAAHWGVFDPNLFQGTDEQKTRLFWDIGLTLKRRVELLLSLPLASLDRIAIHHEVTHIGKR